MASAKKAASLFGFFNDWNLKKSTCILRMVPGSYLRECQLVDTKVRSWASRYADVILFESIILLMEEIRLTSWYGKYLIIYRGSYMSGGAGFLNHQQSYHTEVVTLHFRSLHHYINTKWCKLQTIWFPNDAWSTRLPKKIWGSQKIGFRHLPQTNRCDHI